MLELGQVHGPADDEHAAGNGQARQDFAKDDEAPEGVEEDADIGNEADDDGIGRRISIGHPDLGDDAEQRQAAIIDPVAMSRHDEAAGQGHEDDAGQGGTDQEVQDDFIRVMTAGTGELAHRRIGTGGKDGLPQGEQGIDVERRKIPGPDDEAAADEDDEQRQFRPRRQDFL